MLFNLLTSFIDHYSFLNVFKYLTFRTGLSVVTSLVVVFIIGGPLIKIFSTNMISGPIRQDGPIDHIIKKSGTPTMGGVIIIIGMLTSTLLWADLNNIYIWTLVFVSLSLGLLGFADETVDGVMGKRTFEALKKFAIQHDLSDVVLRGEFDDLGFWGFQQYIMKYNQYWIRELKNHQMVHFQYHNYYSQCILVTHSIPVKYNV